MSSAPSQTKVCNGALTHLGESHKITAITDPTPIARQLAGVWDEAVDEVLADHPWNIAIWRASCPVSADVTPEGSQYSQAFEKPDDCVRWLPYRSGHPDYFEGEEEGDFILSDADAPITIRYIRRIDNMAKWTPGMRAALAVKIAQMTAKSITGQSTMIDRMSKLYDDKLDKAKRQDGAATGDRERFLEPQSDWLAARNRPSPYRGPGR